MNNKGRFKVRVERTLVFEGVFEGTPEECIQAANDELCTAGVVLDGRTEITAIEVEDDPWELAEEAPGEQPLSALYEPGFADDWADTVQ